MFVFILNLITVVFVKVVFGNWLIEGYPQVILFDIKSAANKLDQWKKEFWESCHIGIPNHDYESNDALIFGFLVCWFIGEVRCINYKLF